MVVRERYRFVVGSFGLGLVLAGLLVFFEQLYHAIVSGYLESVPVSALVKHPIVLESLPTGFVRWVQRIPGAFEAEGFVTWVLDEVPLALFLLVLGGVAAWRTLLREPRPSRRR